MVSDVGGVFVDGTRIELLDRVSNSRMKLLLTRCCDVGKERLPYKFVRKREWLLRPLGAWDDYSHLLGLLDDCEEFVNVDLADRAVGEVGLAELAIGDGVAGSRGQQRHGRHDRRDHGEHRD